MAGETTTNYATIFSLGTGASAPYTYAPVGEVVTIKMPKVTSAALESTNHSSAGKATYIGSGLVKVDEGSITVNYKSTDTFYAGVGSTFHAKVEFPNGVDFTFDMIVTGFEANEADSTSPEILQATIGFQPATIPAATTGA